MIDYKIIATGSQGNSVVIGNEVMVDVGVSYKAIAPYMGALRLVLLTHEHQDHFKPSTVKRMAFEKPLLRFGCGDFMVKHLIDAGVPKSRIDVLQENMLYTYKPLCQVIPVGMVHDVPNFGYKIFFDKGKVFYATDTGSLGGVQARNYDLYLVEANYIDNELKARMDAKLEAGEYAYERRVIGTHLSKKQADDWIYRNMGQNSEYVYLHCHREREKDESADFRV